jgi:putative transcriptional regulator
MQGKLLISSPAMDDPHFKNTIILITEYNANGALGFIINKPFERRLNELTEFATSPAFTLFAGGPVDDEHLYFVHRRNDLIPGGQHIIDDIFLGGDFKQALSHINNNNIDNTVVKLFIGYCGWDAMELESEIAEGSWTVIESTPDIIFAEDVALLLPNIFNARN